MDKITVLMLILWLRYRRRRRVCDGPVDHARLVRSAPKLMRRYLEV